MTASAAKISVPAAAPEIEAKVFEELLQQYSRFAVTMANSPRRHRSCSHALLVEICSGESICFLQLARKNCKSPFPPLTAFDYSTIIHWHISC
jgi:hypothetical protein